MGTIDAFWRGKLSLGKAFWIFGVCVNFALAFIMAIGMQVAGSAFAIQALAGLGLVIYVFTWIGQWRCAFNTQRPFLGVLLRMWLVITAVAAIGNTLPYLPAPFETAVGGLIVIAVVFAVGYAVFAPFRDYVRLLLYKRKHRDD